MDRPGSRSGSEFDAHVEDWEDQCMRGVSLSGESKEFFALGRIAHLRRWWSHSGRAAPKRILDWGCGIGDVTARLADAFPTADVLGVDPSAASVERARSEHGSSRVRFAAPDVDDGPADLIHTCGVVHHVDVAARPVMFERLAERMAPDGAVAVYENNPLNPGTRWVMARIPFDRDATPVGARAIRHHLRGCGLEPVDTTYLFYFPAFLRALRPLERFLTAVPLGAQYAVIAERPWLS